MSAPATQPLVITGAAGLLGQRLRSFLEAQGGFDLRLIDREPRSDASIVCADLSVMSEAWTAQFDGAQAVVHLAANASASAPWDSLLQPNIDAVLNVYETARQHGVRRVILASSVWAMASRHDGVDPIAAGKPDPGGNAYGATKVFAERVADFHWRNHGISSVVLRIGGCRPGPNLPRLQDRWANECWLSTPDFCRGVMKALQAEPGCHVVNLVSQHPAARWSLAEARELIGFEPQDIFLPPPEPSRLQRLWRRLANRLSPR